MQKFVATKNVLKIGLTSLLLSIATNSYASGFQLFEENAAGVGDYHAGGAAEANDASTGFYNPAGLVRIKNQQAVLGVVFIPLDIKFKGTIQVSTFDDLPHQTTSQGGSFNTIPNFHYAAPITDKLVFGIGVTVPFGLETDYSDTNLTRFAATKTTVTVINIGPSLGYALTDKLSIGGGVDIQHMKGEFDQFGGVGGDPTTDFATDTESTNEGSDWGVGYNFGVLFQFNQSSRIGLSYRSQVAHLLRGTSKFVGQLANGAAGGIQESSDLKASIILPPTTQMSFYQGLSDKWALLGSARFTQWSSVRNLVLRNVAAIDDSFNATNMATIVVNEGYHNTWSFALGTHYQANEQWTLKAGIGYDQTPTNDSYRNLQLPDSNKFIAAIGAHFQPSHSFGFDAGWTHLFPQRATLNTSQTEGLETVKTVGHADTNADVIGFQVTWNIA